MLQKAARANKNDLPSGYLQDAGEVSENSFSDIQLGIVLLKSELNHQNFI